MASNKTGNNILIYESNALGHQTEFIEYLMEYFMIHSYSGTVVFLLNELIINDLKELIGNLKEGKKDFFFYSINHDRLLQFKGCKSVLKRSLLEKELLEEYFTSFNINHVVLPEIDSFQFVIGLWRFSKFSKIKVNGILYNPVGQNPKSRGGAYFRKLLQLKWIFLNNSVNRIFILNDTTAVEKMNGSKLLPNKFFYLPDPLKTRNFNKIDIRKKYKIGKDKKILLAAGGIQKRKNLNRIAETVRKIDSHDDFCLLILGKNFDDEIYDKLLIQAAKNDRIIIDNRFISTDEFESALSEAEVVLVVYQEFYASSGLIGNAAKHGKLVLASNQGVIGQKTHDYNLGITIDPNSEEELYNGIEYILKNNPKAPDNREYIKDHDYIKFAEKLLSF